MNQPYYSQAIGSYPTCPLVPCSVPAAGGTEFPKASAAEWLEALPKLVAPALVWSALIAGPPLVTAGLAGRHGYKSSGGRAPATAAWATGGLVLGSIGWLLIGPPLLGSISALMSRT